MPQQGGVWGQQVYVSVIHVAPYSTLPSFSHHSLSLSHTHLLFISRTSVPTRPHMRLPRTSLSSVTAAARQAIHPRLPQASRPQAFERVSSSAQTRHLARGVTAQARARPSTAAVSSVPLRAAAGQVRTHTTRDAHYLKDLPGQSSPTFEYKFIADDPSTVSVSWRGSRRWKGDGVWGVCAMWDP